MLNLIDRFLNKITMYRLVLYYLIGLWTSALMLSFWGVLPFSAVGLWLSLAVILAVCAGTNLLFAKVFRAQANVESVYITALILALIITPLKAPDYVTGLSFFIWASVWAMASKYIFAIGKKHVFNPAAFAVALTALTLHQSASW